MSQYLSDLWRPCRCLWSSVDKRVLREASKLRPIVRLKSTSSGLADTALSADSTLPDENDSKIRYDNAKPFHEIPGPKGMPYLGTMLEYTRGPYSIARYHDALLERYRRYGKIFKETIAGETVVHLFDPDYIQVVYQNEGKIPHIAPLVETTQMYRKYRKMSPGLGNTNGEEWYRLRSAVQRMMLAPKTVPTFIPHVSQVADDFIRRIHKIRDRETGEVDEFENEVYKWNLESSTMTCFESRLGCFDAGKDSWQQKMIDSNKKIFALSTKMRFSLPLYKFVRTRDWKTLLEAEDFFFGKGQEFVDRTCSQIKTLMDNGQLTAGQFSFMTYLMGRSELEYKDVSIIALSLFSDGLSTTAPTLIGQLYCLATNPDKQDRLYEQICKVAGNKEEPVTPEVIQDASYLRACIKEGFRFFPIGVDVSRILQKDVVIGDYQIPAGTRLSLNNNLLLRQMEYFDDPDAYQPERWSRDGTTSHVHPYLLLPFGFGPRTCAGMRLAEQELRIVILKLIQNFRIEWPDSAGRMSQKYSLLLSPDCPARFRFIPRS